MCDGTLINLLNIVTLCVLLNVGVALFFKRLTLYIVYGINSCVTHTGSSNVFKLSFHLNFLLIHLLQTTIDNEYTKLFATDCMLRYAEFWIMNSCYCDAAYHFGGTSMYLTLSYGWKWGGMNKWLKWSFLSTKHIIDVMNDCRSLSVLTFANRTIIKITFTIAQNSPCFQTLE